MDTINRFRGCIYGLAIGDALGFPNEFLRLLQIREKYGESGLEDFKPAYGLPAGSYSDDTQMSLALARAIIKTDDFDVENFMGYVKDEFVAWSKSPENNRAPGGACMTGCVNMEKGVHWKESGDSWSKGCGAAMRAAPLGLVFHKNTEKLFELAYAASVCTHGNPTGIASGIGTAYAVGLILGGVEPLEIVDKVCDIPHATDEYTRKMRQVKGLLEEDLEVAIPVLGEGWVGEEALAIALYIFNKFPRDYKRSVLAAANTNGDSDSLACITGALSGAFNGIETIPETWIRRVENSELLRETADKLYRRYLGLC